MHRRLASLTFAICTVCASGAPMLAQQVAAPQADSPQSRKFELSVSAMGKSQLSRSEVDPQAINMGSLASRTPQASPLPIGNSNPGAVISRAHVPAAPMGTLAGKAQQDDTPGAFMHEYNVDWSTWVSSLADKWFYVLRTSENGLGVQFMTPRPALIQFTCYADGTIGNIFLKQSSGVPVYDQLQISTLMLVIPNAPFPHGTKRTSITLIQGWESHQKHTGESDFQPGSFGKDFPAERVRQWVAGR